MASIKPDLDHSPEKEGNIGMILESGVVGDEAACSLVENIEISVSDGRELLELNHELEKMLDLKNTLSTPPPTIDMDPLECHALQLEEVESLKAIFDSDLTAVNDDFTCFSVDIKFLSGEIEAQDTIKIWFSLPPNYPCVPPVFEIETNQSGTFTFSDADELFDILMTGAISHLGGIMIYDLITLSQEHLPKVLERHKEEAEKRRFEDEERKKEIEMNDALKNNKGFIPSHLWKDLDLSSDSKQEEDIQECMEEEAEHKMYIGHHSNHHPAEFIGPISKIIQKLPPTLQITRIENVIRQDLAERFVSCHKEMINLLWKRERDRPMQYSLQPQIAFHGTLTKSLPSIVQHGLVIPGDNNRVAVRCGSSLGRGIYLSPSADFSLGYTDSYRLIVCAALLGMKIREFNDFSRNRAKHFVLISSSEFEWVFFNAAQVLPCYVIQVARKMEKVVPPPLADINSESDADGLDQHKKMRLQARARKYLPFGFGPGSKTVILEAGEIDDDEEDYGDYQLLRYTTEEGGAMEQKSELQYYRKAEANEPF